MTINAALARAAGRLRRAGVETPLFDAELLLAHLLGRERAYLLAHPELELEGRVRVRFNALLRRRAAREPLPYLLGRWEFLGMSFLVTPAVLIPRPETEALVEALAARLTGAARILEIGTGSGCVAIGLARLLPEARVLALEPSAAALAVARENAAALGCAARIEFMEGSFPALTPAALGGRFDALAANPPYVPTPDLENLEPEVRVYEPREALDGGPDGLTVLRALAEAGPDYLRPGGWLAAEVGLGQAEAVQALLRARSWQAVEALSDLAGIPRVLLARAGA